MVGGKWSTLSYWGLLQFVQIGVLVYRMAVFVVLWGRSLSSVVRSDKRLRSSLASLSKRRSMLYKVGIIIHLMPVIFIGSVLVIISTTYRFARRNSQS